MSTLTMTCVKAIHNEGGKKIKEIVALKLNGKPASVGDLCVMHDNPADRGGGDWKVKEIHDQTLIPNFDLGGTHSGTESMQFKGTVILTY